VSELVRTIRISWVKAVILATFSAFALMLAAPANADVDTDFANELHTYGIYGQRDYNAWIGKIVCKRMRTGLDANAPEAALFLRTNLHKDSSEQQVYDFLGASIRYYCPDQQPVLDRLSGGPAPAPAAPAGPALPAEQG
jgi:hypothetical protein